LEGVRLRQSASAVDSALPRVHIISAETYTPSIHTVLAANGSVTEVYIPPGLSASLFPVQVIGSAQLTDLVTWPDGSRSAYVAPTGSGVYGVLVTNSSSSALSMVGEDASAEEVLAALTAGRRQSVQIAKEQAARVPTSLQEAAAAAVAVAEKQEECDGPACALGVWLEWVGSVMSDATKALGGQTNGPMKK
jgi:hypothetical protein